jgi:hypothetical protein
MGLPGHTGTRREQTINRRCGAKCRRMGLEPQGVPVSDVVIGNIETSLTAMV